MTENNHAAELHDLLEDQRFLMLTTLDEHGALVSRPMTVQEVEGWKIRFITQADNAVTGQAEARQVNLAAMDGSTYLSLSGTGSVERDVQKKRELWDRLTEAYADDPEDPKNVILVVTAESGEYWDSGNLVATLAGLAKAAITGERPDGEHGKAQL